LILENALEQICRDTSIKGTFVPGMGEWTLLSYADSTVFFPPNIKSIENILNTFQVFGQGSGAEIMFKNPE
jgi:hypothetical protein